VSKGYIITLEEQRILSERVAKERFIVIYSTGKNDHKR